MSIASDTLRKFGIQKHEGRMKDFDFSITVTSGKKNEVSTILTGLKKSYEIFQVAEDTLVVTIDHKDLNTEQTKIENLIKELGIKTAKVERLDQD